MITKLKVVFERDLRTVLSNSKLAQSYGVRLDKVLAFPGMVLASGFKQGFNPNRDFGHLLDEDFRIFFVGSQENERFLDAFRENSRGICKISLRGTTFFVEVIFSRGAEPGFVFTAFFEADGRKGICPPKTVKVPKLGALR